MKKENYFMRHGGKSPTGPKNPVRGPATNEEILSSCYSPK